MIIYKTTNLINGKIYIGQDSKNDNKYIGSGYLLCESIKKYGRENFVKEILENCESKQDLDEKEIYWIKYYNSTDNKIGYNISNGGTGGKLVDVEWKKGKTYEEVYGDNKAKELKELYSTTRKGKERGWKNTTPEETGKKISESLKLKNIKRSKEEKEKISNSLKEYFKTPDGIKTKNKIKESKIGIKQTKESNIKRSLALKGKCPKKIEIHGNSKIWQFYDKENNLIIENIGNLKESLKKLECSWRTIKKFNNLEECLKYQITEKIKYKVYYRKYYDKKLL